MGITFGSVFTLSSAPPDDMAREVEGGVAEAASATDRLVGLFPPINFLTAGWIETLSGFARVCCFKNFFH